MRRYHSTLLAGVALGAVLPVTAASAAAGVTAAGSATSTATLATVAVGSLAAGAVNLAGHTVSIGTLTAGAQTLSPSVAPSVTFVPLTVDGTQPAGSVTVTPSTSPKTVGAVSTGALPLNILSATSPSATLAASQTTSSRSSTLASKLGSASILGLPVTLDGGLDVGSVTDGAHSQAGKSLTFSNVSLPNLADLLAALGIDLTKLPAATLNALIDQLQVTISSAQQTAIDAANTAVGTAQTAYDAAKSDFDTAAADLDAALASATLPPGTTGPIDHAAWDALDPLVQTAIITLNGGVGGALDLLVTAYDATKTPLADATTALAGVTADLGDAVAGVLAGTALVQVGAAVVSTKALVGATKSAAVTGYVSGVKVLGTDVLAAVTGNTKVDAAALVGNVANQVNAALASTMATLSNVLSSATGATGLVVPAPSVKLLTKQATTGVDGAFGIANATVTALSVSLGSVTVPDAFALTGAGSLAGIAPISGGFKTSPMSVAVGTLVESARFRGATSGEGNLPATGVPGGLAVLAVIGTGLAFGARRRLREE